MTHLLYANQNLPNLILHYFLLFSIKCKVKLVVVVVMQSLLVSLFDCIHVRYIGRVRTLFPPPIIILEKE